MTERGVRVLIFPTDDGSIEVETLIEGDTPNGTAFTDSQLEAHEREIAEAARQETILKMRELLRDNVDKAEHAGSLAMFLVDQMKSWTKQTARRGK